MMTMTTIVMVLTDMALPHLHLMDMAHQLLLQVLMVSLRFLMQVFLLRLNPRYLLKASNLTDLGKAESPV